jgi:hypothetical protein
METLSIVSSGCVGLGTSAPAYPLEVLMTPDCDACQHYKRAVEQLSCTGFKLQVPNTCGMIEPVSMKRVRTKSHPWRFFTDEVRHLQVTFQASHVFANHSLCGEEVHDFVHVGLRQMRDEIPIPVKDLCNIVIEMLVGVLLKE